MKVKELHEILGYYMNNDKSIGEKEIWISNDEEGNGYHFLFYGLMTQQEDIDAIADMKLFDYAPDDTNKVVILG